MHVSKNKEIPKLRIGAAFYPELWPAEEFEKDLLRIKEANLNAVRLAEFTWALLEPENGLFEYKWLHKILTRLQEEDIAVVLGTPSAAPPAWLNIDHPDALTLTDNGRQITHGGRYHLCKSSTKARFFANRIAENMAREFGNYPNLIAWQIDNELEPFPCYCDICRQKFHEFLERRYGSIEELNHRWNTNFWSQKYRSFSDIPLPEPERVRPRHHPSLVYTYKIFQNVMHCEFAHEQAECIRKHSSIPLTHNSLFRDLLRIDNRELFSKLDFHSVDIYFDADNYWKYAYEFDWLRPASNTPFWLMETASSWNGGIVAVHPLIHREHAIYTKIWMHFAMGGNGLFFWPLRMQWAGQETCHGAIYYQNGTPTPALDEIKHAISEINQYADLLTETVPEKPDLAVHLYDLSRAAFEAEPVTYGFNVIEQQYEVYRHLMQQGVRCDLVDPRSDISDYKAIFTPFCPVFPDSRIDDMLQFVDHGGTWIVGPLSMNRTEDLTVFRSRFFGRLEELAGFRVLHHLPTDHNVLLQTSDGLSSECNLFCDAFEVTAPHRILACYTSGGLAGFNAIVEMELGKGRLVLLGTWPNENVLGALIKTYVSHGDCGKDFIQIRRRDSEGTLRAMITLHLEAYKVDVEMVSDK